MLVRCYSNVKNRKDTGVPGQGKIPAVHMVRIDISVSMTRLFGASWDGAETRYRVSYLSWGEEMCAEANDRYSGYMCYTATGWVWRTPTHSVVCCWRQPWPHINKECQEVEGAGRGWHGRECREVKV